MMLRRTLLAVACAATFAAAASANTISLTGGGKLTVLPASQLRLPGPSSGGSLTGVWGGGLAYVLTEASGQTWSGTIPGTGSGLVGEPSLAQNPLTGEIFVAFSRQEGSSTHVAFTTWTGQQWIAPLALTAGVGRDTQPALSFGELGDAILAWRHEEFLPTVLVRNFVLGASGPAVSYSFSDLGSPASLMRAAGGATGLRDGIVHTVTDSVARRGYLFLADERSAQVGVVRLNLDALYQGGGFNAPPVPVAVIRPAPQSAGNSRPVGERSSDPATLLAPWRLVLGPDAVAYYWTEPDRLAVVLFRGGAGGKLVSLPLPADEAQVHGAAYHAALREMGLLERRAAERATQRRR